MNFPLINTFEIGESTIDFLNKKFDQYVKEKKKLTIGGDFIYLTDTGVFTEDLCGWDDKEFAKFVDWLTDLFIDKLNLPRERIKIHFTHFFDYRDGGSVTRHDHIAAEDYVMIVYTNTCASGDTIFYLNPHPNHCERTMLRCKPKKGLAVLFSSMMIHEVEYTSEPKRIFVVGVRINTKGGV